MPNTKTLPAADLHAAIDRLVAAIARRHANTPRLLLLGIANGGVELVRRIAAGLAATHPPHPIASGTIDISFHRDDIDKNPITKELAPTQIPIDVTNASVILVDDVLFSGRTAKAALDELFDHGRPHRVELAALIDRGGRMLPFAADYTGLTFPAGETEKVIVTLDPDNPSNDRASIATVRR